MPNHTPGEWTVRAVVLPDGRRTLSICTDATQEQMYERRDRFDPENDEHRSRAFIAGVESAHVDSLANAHLIAAAPELLAALEGVYAWAAQLSAGPAPEMMERGLADILTIARAAIQKARG